MFITVVKIIIAVVMLFCFLGFGTAIYAVATSGNNPTHEQRVTVSTKDLGDDKFQLKERVFVFKTGTDSLLSETTQVRIEDRSDMMDNGDD